MMRQVANDEGWNVCFVPLESLHGFAVVRGDRRVMVINCALPRAYQRMTIAHEMAHDLNGDAGVMWMSRDRTGTFADWIWDRCERDATLAAAEMLIPLDRMAIGAEPEEVAAICDVPLELVTLYADHLRATM